MRKRILLPERANYFYFDHKPSEINYGGKMRFQQVAWPKDEGLSSQLEPLIFNMINRLVGMILDRTSPRTMDFGEWKTDQDDIFTDDEGSEPLVFKNWHNQLTDIYFDQWCETPLLSLTHFQKWIHEDVVALAGAYRKIRINAIRQERITGIFRLNYFITLALTTLISEMISEYFNKQIDSLGKLATLARFTIGRCLAVAFLSIEESETLSRIRHKELGDAQIDEGCIRLFNPFVLSLADVADTGMIEEILSGPNPYQLSHSLRTQIINNLKEILEKSRRFEFQQVTKIMTEKKTLQVILESRKERKRILAVLRRNRDIRSKIVFENVRYDLRQMLRDYVRLCADPADVFSYISNERQLEEIFNKPAVQKRLMKLLKIKHDLLTDAIKKRIKEHLRILKKSRKNYFGRLSKKDLLQEFKSSALRCSDILCHIEDFRLVRSQYGKDSNRAIQWQGIRVWRSYAMVYKSQNRLDLEPIWEKQRADIENNFAEGNLFYCLSKGDIYPHAQQRRNRVVFLFADLRNSTETTMKLTKDTASFLTPYLTAVNSSALKCSGKRIYFAGDGYAAYYAQAGDAVRAAYTITAQFAKLRKVSSEEHIREAKEIYQTAIGLVRDLKKPEKVKQAMTQSVVRKASAKVLEFLSGLAEAENGVIGDGELKKILSQVAAAYSMPRVDVGVALTNGELFLALVGDEKDTTVEKIPIVISPQLTQAARLSGSSDLVRKYIDTHFSQPFPFNAYTWDKKLYNRGIVITQDLFMQLAQESKVQSFEDETCEYQKQGFFQYFDEKLKRRIVLRLNQEPVILKGIEAPCPVYEVATMGSYLDKKFGMPEQSF